MKLLFDENLSPRLVELLGDVYPGSRHVHDARLGSAEDAAVWDYAREYEFAIVSKDSDFAERAVLVLDAPKVIWIRLGNCSTAEVEAVLRAEHEAVTAFLERREEVCLLLERAG